MRDNPEIHLFLSSHPPPNPEITYFRGLLGDYPKKIDDFGLTLVFLDLGPPCLYSIKSTLKFDMSSPSWVKYTSKSHLTSNFNVQIFISDQFHHPNLISKPIYTHIFFLRPPPGRSPEAKSLPHPKYASSRGAYIIFLVLFFG